MRLPYFNKLKYGFEKLPPLKAATKSTVVVKKNVALNIFFLKNVKTGVVIKC